MSRVGWLWHRVVVHNKTECTNFAKNVQLVRFSKSNLSTRRWLVVILALTHQWVSRQYIFFFRSFNFMSFHPCFVGDALKCFLILWTKLSGYIVAHSWPEISTNIVLILVWFHCEAGRRMESKHILVQICINCTLLTVFALLSWKGVGFWILDGGLAIWHWMPSQSLNQPQRQYIDISYIYIVSNTIVTL